MGDLDDGRGFWSPFVRDRECPIRFNDEHVDEDQDANNYDSEEKRQQKCAAAP
jgi:hypothetical protein